MDIITDEAVKRKRDRDVTLALFVAFYDSARTPESAEGEETSFEDLADALTSPEGLRTTTCVPKRLLQEGDFLCIGKTCPQKDGPAWSPVQLSVAYRNNDNVTQVTCAVLDFDHITSAQVLDVITKLAPYDYAIYSTHSHEATSEDADNCLRAVIRLSRPVPAAEWRGCLRAIVATLAVPADPTCKDLSRLYYLPTTTQRVEPFMLRGRGGGALDVDALLASPEAKAPKAAASRLTEEEEPEEEDLNATIDLKDLRKTVLSYRRNKKSKGQSEQHELMTRLLDGKPLAQEGARQVTLHQAMSCFAWATKAAPWPAAFEILRPSLTAMETEPEGLSHWIDSAYNSYMRAIDDRAEKIEDYAKRMSAMRERLLSSRTARPTKAPVRPGIPVPSALVASSEVSSVGAPAYVGAPALPTTPTPNEDPVNENPVNEDGEGSNFEEVDAEPWEGRNDGRLIMTSAKGPDGKPVTQPKSCSYNARTVLNYDPELRGFIRFNRFSHDITVTGGFLHGVNPEVHGIELNNYLQKYYSIDIGRTYCEHEILGVAHENEYDSLLDYLTPLEQLWDGNERIHLVLEYLCDAPLIDAEGRDITDYVRTISRKWCIGAVARAVSPGVQMDNVLVLESNQGNRKTSFLRALFSGFFATAHLDITDKDTKMMASNTWGMELAELSSLKKSETEAQKAFFTITSDKFRPPYGRRLQDTPRRCVFVGTTNESTYLTDTTGNRRYWPIRCGVEMYSRLKELTPYVRDQIWAEALVNFRLFQKAKGAGMEDDLNPKNWWLSKSEQAVANEQTESRMEDTQTEIYATRISDWYYGLVPGRRKRQISTAEVGQAIGMSLDRITHGTATKIGKAMSGLGFVKRKKRDGGKTFVWVYEATEEMFTAAVRGVANDPVTTGSAAE